MSEVVSFCAAGHQGSFMMPGEEKTALGFCIVCNALTDNWVDGKPLCPECESLQRKNEGEKNGL